MKSCGPPRDGSGVILHSEPGARYTVGSPAAWKPPYQTPAQNSVLSTPSRTMVFPGCSAAASATPVTILRTRTLRSYHHLAPALATITEGARNTSISATATLRHSHRIRRRYSSAVDIAYAASI